MNPNDLAAASINLNFDNVEEAAGSNITQPGTISVFTITGGEYLQSKEKGTPGLKLTFEDTLDGSSFNHTFWLTASALGRIQHLAKHTLKQALSGAVTPANLIAVFKGKKLPLKVTAQINDEKGRVYPDLPFGGFTADKLEELKFSSSELAEIERSKTVSANAKVANADVEPKVSGLSQKANDF
jgi:hypothetical protein